MKSVLKQKVQFAFGFALLTLLLIGSASYHWISVSEDSSHWVWHTRQNISHIQNLLLSMESIDSSSREYVLTSKESSLQPYYLSIQKIDEEREAIRSLTLDIEVLLVEDSPGDVRLTQEAFREANGAIHLHVACDGVEAMAFLMREGDYLHVPRPDFILLDLNLPKMDGREVLAQIKNDESLKVIPTIIMTSSEAEADIVKCYQLQANSYLSKPVQLDEFETLVKSINDFWLVKAKLPQQR
jgi:CheY-like chemotaxis protein